MMAQRSFMPEEFQLGCPSIDTQHELIFAMYHELLTSQQQEAECYDLETVFLGLNGYAATHFAHEEQLMRRSGFPGIEAHVHEHRVLGQDVALLRGRFVQAKSVDEANAIAGEVAVFLHDWLTHHIAEVDRELCLYLQEHAPTSHEV
ncbi:MAG: hemerythrin family protein [Magnetococcales bacterium]|nr:hemerythrin family protein [Magnetococcales bacterium]